jgi:hypothetical protein
MTGCSSAPKQSKLVNNQYCYTSQTIQSKDKETVTSTTTVKCSDDPVEQYVPAKMGIAKECGEVYVPMNLGGRLVREKVIACKKHDGHYSVIDSATLR